jgi:CHAT domain-containing protein
MRVILTLLCAFVSFFVFACSSTSTITQPISSQPDISPEARTLFKKADALYKEGKFLESARTGERALEASHNALPVNTADTLLLETARLYKRGGASTDAIRVLKFLLQHPPSSPQEHRLHAEASYSLGGFLYENGQIDEASRHLAAAYDTAKKFDDPFVLYHALTGIYLIESHRGHHEAAIRALNEKLVVLPRVKDLGPDQRLLVLEGLGYAHKDLKQYAEAEAIASQYLKEAEALGDLVNQEKALYFQGHLKYAQGELSEAADAYFAAARKASEIPDMKKAMDSFKIGFDLVEALKEYDRMKGALLVALNRYDEVGEDPLDKAFLLSKLGQVFVELGRYDLGNARLFDAYVLYRDAGSHREAGYTANHLGKLMRFLRDFPKAYGYFSIMKEHATKAEDLELLVIAHKNLGALYERFGLYSDALQEFKEAREIYNLVGETDLILTAESAIINLYYEIGDIERFREEVDRLERRLNRDSSISNNNAWLYWLQLSMFYSVLGDTSKEKEFASRAVSVAREANDVEGKIQTLTNLALHMEKNYAAYDESISLLQEAISIAKEHRAAEYYSWLHTSLGITFLAQGRLEDAVKAFNIGIANTESTLDEIVVSETRVSFIAKSLAFGGPYDGLIRALYAMFKRDKDPRVAEKALLVHEKSRAREFARMLTRSRIEKIRNTVPENLRKQEERLGAEIERLQAEVHNPDYAYEKVEKVLNNKLAQLKSQQTRYDKLMSEIQKQYPQYTITKLRDLGNVTRLPIRSGEAILIYRLASNGIFVWVLTHSPKGAEIQSFSKINANIPSPIAKILASSMRNEPGGLSKESLRHLSDAFLKPVSSNLTSASQLTIVRDGDLGRLPFEMLPSPDNSQLMVLDRWTVSYYPSLLTMVVNRSTLHPRKDRAGSALLVGDVEYKQAFKSQEGPTQGVTRGQLRSVKSLAALPFSAVEIERVGKLFKLRQVPTTTLRRNKASEKQIKQLDLEGFDYLHFAVHGVQANEIVGLNEPSLALSVNENGEDGFLTASEVMGLKLNAKLVVLSACDTALGNYHLGEGFSNLARAFMSAGAESVIVSQWAVEDQSTAEIMVELYRNLAKGLPAPEALKAAKNTLRERHPSPYYWAPFVLVGG